MNWFNIQPQAGANGEIDIFVFDEIGTWGVGADKVIAEIQALKPLRINLHVNSPGGSIVDGLAIYNYLRAHSAPVTVYIDSMAASIAGVIAMAGDEIVMAEASLLHMHLPGINGYISEKVDGLEELTVALRKMDQVIRGIYKKRGATDEQLEEWMSGETYFTAAEALSLGLVDRVEDRVRMVACAGRWDPQRNPSAQAALRAHNFTGGHHAGAQPQQHQNQKESKMELEKIQQENATLKAEAKLKDSTIADLQKKSEAAPAQLEEAIKNATDKAIIEYQAAEKLRLESIQSVIDKYDVAGDVLAKAQELHAFTDSAISREAILEAALDVVAARPTSQRLENGDEQAGKQAKKLAVAEYQALCHPERRKFRAEGGIIVDVQ